MGTHWGNIRVIGKMENEMETTIQGLGFRVDL